MYYLDVQWEVYGDTQLAGRFTRLETRLDDFEVPLGQSMDVVEDETRYQFGREGEPSWQSLNPRYARAKRRQWGFTTMLVASGEMFASLVRRGVRGAIAKVTKTEMRRGSSLMVGARRKWNLAALHYAGTDEGLPARPMMRLRRAAQTRIRAFFYRYLFEQGELASIYV